MNEWSNDESLRTNVIRSIEKKKYNKQEKKWLREQCEEIEDIINNVTGLS